MVKLSRTLFKRVRKTMRKKELLECQLGKCLMGECSLIECPVEEWVNELRKIIGYVDEKSLTLDTNIFTALSDPLRIKILKLLEKKKELCACEIQATIGESQSSTSYHLGLLRKAGVVTADKRGVWIYYKISDPTVLSMIEMASRMSKK